jgi:hypothetical protein
MPQSCFSYPSDMPPALPRSPGAGGGVMGPCFSYTSDVFPGRLRRMPGGNPSPCFSYVTGPEALFSQRQRQADS